MWWGAPLQRHRARIQRVGLQATRLMPHHIIPRHNRHRASLNDDLFYTKPTQRTLSTSSQSMFLIQRNLVWYLIKVGTYNACWASWYKLCAPYNIVIKPLSLRIKRVQGSRRKCMLIGYNQAWLCSIAYNVLSRI